MNPVAQARQARAVEVLKHLPPIGTPAVAAEVGVANGLFSELLLAQHPQLVLYLVDLWQHNPSPAYAATRDFNAQKTAPQFWKQRFRFVRRRLRMFDDRTAFLRGDSVEMAETMSDCILDLAFIDDDHSKPGCLRSITAWWPKIRPGGWLTGHDYRHTNPRFRFQVTEAVHEFFDPLGISIHTGPDFTWYVQKP